MFALLLFAPAFADDPLLARVDNQEIHWSDLDGLGEQYVNATCPTAAAGCLAQARAEVFAEWLSIHLAERALDDVGLPITEAVVDARIAAIASSLKLATVEALRVKVEADGMPWDAYRRSMRETLIEDRMQRFLQASGVNPDVWLAWAVEQYEVELMD